jgi:hypothetical protein
MISHPIHRSASRLCLVLPKVTHTTTNDILAYPSERVNGTLFPTTYFLVGHTPNAGTLSRSLKVPTFTGLD